MLRTVRLLSKTWKFMPNREFIIHKDRKSSFRDFVKSSLIGYCVYIGSVVFIYNFAMPTWDVLYDLRMIGSADFREFILRGPLYSTNQMFRNEIEGTYIEYKRCKDTMHKPGLDPALVFGERK